MEISLTCLLFFGINIDFMGVEFIQKNDEQEMPTNSRADFETLFNGTNDSIFVIDLDGHFLEANQMTSESLGYTRHEILQMNLADIDASLGTEQVSDLINETYQQSNSTFETVHVCKDGSTVPVELSNRLINCGGNPAIISICRDITKRKKFEESLKKSEYIYSTLVEKGNDGIAILQDYVIKFANSKFAEITGYTKDEVVGKSFLEHIAPEYRELVWERYKKRIKNVQGIPRRYEVCILSKEGNKIPVEVNASCIEYEGRPADMEILRNITKRKQAEQELKTYAEELKTSNELKDLFTDILTHDLLNPAGVIKGFAELLLEMEDDDKKVHPLQIIKRNNEKLIDIVELAAKFAKLKDVKEIKFKTMDIGSILQDTIGSFSPHLKRKNIRIEVSVNGEYPAIVNPVIEEVFSNLLSNAIKYSPPDSRVLIDVLDYGNEWKVTVTDFDGGIPDESKPYIFDRFRRIEKGNVKGTGLGLAIVKRIIDLHGGEVGVEDNPAGHGSVFWVTIRKA